jgi:putative PIN family toxin of toxin-antitoxin system
VRAVIDTNLVVSALLWGGTPERLIEAAGEGTIQLVTSQALIAELSELLNRAKFAAKLTARKLRAQHILERYLLVAETIEAPANIVPTVTRDPDDDAVLACALAANVDLIVSGDAHCQGRLKQLEKKQKSKRQRPLTAKSRRQLVKDPQSGYAVCYKCLTYHRKRLIPWLP